MHPWRFTRALPLAIPLLLVGQSVAAAQRGGGSGHLHTEGRGHVIVSGSLAAFGAMSRPGALIVVDRAGDAQLIANGRTRLRSLARRPAKPRRMVIRRFVGTLYARGSAITVRISGRRSAVDFAGRGTVRLKGRGMFRLNRGARQGWRAHERWRTLRLRPRPRR